MDFWEIQLLRIQWNIILLEWERIGRPFWEGLQSWAQSVVDHIAALVDELQDVMRGAVAAGGLDVYLLMEHQNRIYMEEDGTMSKMIFPKPVYLAGPIANVGLALARLWRSRYEEMFLKFAVGVFNPAGAWAFPDHPSYEGLPKNLLPKIQHVDDAAIMACGGMVVYWTGVESKGTDHEVSLALSLGMPVIFLIDHWSDAFWEWLHTFPALHAELDSRGFTPTRTFWAQQVEMMGENESPVIWSSDGAWAIASAPHVRDNVVRMIDLMQGES